MSQTRRTSIGRGTRPRSTVGQTRTNEPMVRPTFKTIIKQGIRNGKIGALILLIAGIWALWFVLRSAGFLVEAPIVSGNRSVSSAEITSLADLQGRSIWDIQPDQVAALVAQNTYVATATVDLRLPNTVLINIHEREAVVVWNAAGTNNEVTADGVVLGPSATLTGTVLIINDTRPTPLVVGSRVDVDALNLAQSLNLRMPSEIGWTPSRYEWDPYYGLSVFNNQQQVVFGRMQDNVSLDQKLAILKTMAEGSEAWTFLDLRPEKPYYRPVVTPTATPETP